MRYHIECLLLEATNGGLLTLSKLLLDVVDDIIRSVNSLFNSCNTYCLVKWNRSRFVSSKITDHQPFRACGDNGTPGFFISA